jgi:ubiquinol oxidase
MIRLLVGVLVFVINTVYRDRPIPRFYVLETVARVPYFSYLSVLHFYETLGLWRKSDWLKVHFAESWNELHHLLIMEELGGDKMWIDSP